MVFPTSWFRRPSAPLLGIDISSSSAKLVELGHGKSGDMTLERCAIEQFEPDWIVDGNIEKFDEVAAALRRLVKKSGSRTRNVAMALPSSAVITKKIVLPGGLSEEELELQVESEASQYIPFPLDEVSLDFCELGPAAGPEGDVEVLIAASRRERVQDRQGLAEAAGLKPVIVDIESHAARLAAGRLIERLPGAGGSAAGRKDAPMVALFEIGATTTAMQVLRGDEVLYERDQVFGGAQLNQLIVRQYGFSAEEAETKKRNGELPDDYPATVLQPFVHSLAQEVARALQFFFTSTPYNRVHHLMLAGGSSSLAGLAEVVGERCQVAATLANPFDGMRLGAGINGSRVLREAPSYLTSCGLAMRRFLQ
ncbi:MAG: pilus assembly protein PilM [Xylophilus ampelinus]